MSGHHPMRMSPAERAAAVDLRGAARASLFWAAAEAHRVLHPRADAHCSMTGCAPGRRRCATGQFLAAAQSAVL